MNTNNSSKVHWDFCKIEKKSTHEV